MESLSFHQEDPLSTCRITQPRPCAQAALGAGALWIEGLVRGVFLHVTGPQMSRKAYFIS